MILIVMGPTGVGKTTTGSMLARNLGWEFVDADIFHSPENVEKMKLGIPLDDVDRAPWIKMIRSKMEQWIADHRNVVLACSALKKSYREQLCSGPEVKLVYLKGTHEQIYKRLRSRTGHFADKQLLASQFAILEEPSDAVTVEVTRTPEEIVTEIRQRLGLA